jgi:hypothetical protein
LDIKTRPPAPSFVRAIVTARASGVAQLFARALVLAFLVDSSNERAHPH